MLASAGSWHLVGQHEGWAGQGTEDYEGLRSLGLNDQWLCSFDPGVVMMRWATGFSFQGGWGLKPWQTGCLASQALRVSSDPAPLAYLRDQEPRHVGSLKQGHYSRRFQEDFRVQPVLEVLVTAGDVGSPGPVDNVSSF